jgi:plasmid stabilization system protein ParE
MKITFHSEAEEELDHAVAYYESCQNGLGIDFYRSVFAVIHRIGDFPESGSPLSQKTRRCLLRRFPFGVIYQVSGNEIFVVAVADLRRRPGYWLKRLST